MDIGDALAKVIEEAEEQGFLVRQLPDGMWQFRREGFNLFTQIDTASQLIRALRVLISAGLDFSIPD